MGNGILRTGSAQRTHHSVAVEESLYGSSAVGRIEFSNHVSQVVHAVSIAVIPLRLAQVANDVWQSGHGNTRGKGCAPEQQISKYGSGKVFLHLIHLRHTNQ